MLNNNDSWYCLTPCDFPEGQWRLTQHTWFRGHMETLDDFSDVTTTPVAEGSKEQLLHAVRKNCKDVFFPETNDEPIFYLGAR